jgi:hypothetical protein
MALSFLAGPFGFSSPQLTLESQFNDWAAKHGKVYGSEERAERLAKWSANLQVVNEHNAEYEQGLHTFNLEMNYMADLSNAEYQKIYLGLNKQPTASRPSSAAASVQSDFSGTPPASVNWRLTGVSGRVKDQGQCGSCWAFSAVATMEGAFNLKNNGSIPTTCSSTCGPHSNPCCEFSEQEVVDCTLGGADTCDLGGEMHDGIMEIVSNHGGKMNTEAQYKYTSGNSGVSRGKCLAKVQRNTTASPAPRSAVLLCPQAPHRTVLSCPVLSLPRPAPPPRR